MPILTAPLMSLQAKKALAKTVTFYRSRGQDLARQRVVPTNPRTPGQTANRDAFTAATKLAAFVNQNAINKAGFALVASLAGMHETAQSRAVRAARADFGNITANSFELGQCNTPYNSGGVVSGGFSLKKNTAAATTPEADETDQSDKLKVMIKNRTTGTSQSVAATWDTGAKAYTYHGTLHASTGDDVLVEVYNGVNMIAAGRAAIT